MNKNDIVEIERHEHWIKQSAKQIEFYKKEIKKEEKCIDDLRKLNREIKGRE